MRILRQCETWHALNAIMTSHYHFVVLLSSLLTIVGPFNASHRYLGTQVIPHPSDAMKDVIRDNSYAIVFDGGSTGTRVHIFSFTSQILRRTRKIFLENEIFETTTPGLSSYASNGTEAANSIMPLLRKALSVVPELKAYQTNVILKATAGLRLIPKESAQSILKSVEQLLISSPYKVEDNAVSILDDRDEGLYAWYTVNFLLSKLHDITTSLVTIDLGGGSTQITFATNDTETLVRTPSGAIVKRDIEGEPQYIYTQSYLGYGLMSARSAILLYNKTLDKANSRVVHVSHPCFENIGNKTEKWKFGGITYFISGERNVLNSFERCYQIVKSLVSSVIHKPEEIKSREVYGLSYIYDRMADVRVIKSKIGVIKVRDYYLTAENVCNAVIRMRNQNAFLCLDLAYITALLHDGFGLEWQKDITLVKKINGIETSWALGAALNLLDFGKE